MQSSDSTKDSAVTSTKKRHGFANMDPARQREVSSRGGKVAHQNGRAHEFTSEEARIAGQKGGTARSRNVRNSTN